MRVAKHGNRSITSKCGSADVMEALGVNINLPPARMAACLEEVGIAFLFAPAMHSAMKYVQPARRELRLRTVFNLLGPLTNPAHASAQVVGVYSDGPGREAGRSPEHAGTAARAGGPRLRWTGRNHHHRTRPASPKCATAQVHTYEVTPEEFGIQRARQSKRSRAATRPQNARIIQELLSESSRPAATWCC